MTVETLSAEKYEIKVLRSLEELEHIRETWEELNYHPNADIDHFRAIVEIRNEIERPHIIVLYINGIPKLLIVGRIEDIKIPIKFGYRTLLNPRLRSLTIIYGGILGDASLMNCKIILKELKNTLKKREAEIVTFSNLDIKSDLFKVSAELTSFYYRDNFPAPSIHWQLLLPESYDKYISSLPANIRSNVKRRAKKIQNDLGDKIEIKLYSTEEDFEKFIKDLEIIASKTYQRGLGAGFVDNNENRIRFKLFIKQHCLHIYILYIDGSPEAFWYGIEYKNIFFGEATAYNSKYHNYSLGIYLLMRGIDILCQNKQIEKIDFGFGDAVYKRDYANLNWEEASVIIFNSSIKCITINIIRSLILIASHTAKKILQDTNLLIKVKKIWRKKISSQN